MKQQVKTDLQKVIRFLENRKMDFKVVGSIALEVCGMPLNREPEDIDLEVVCSNRQEEIFKALAEQYGNDFFTHAEYNITGCSHKPYIFKFGETKINVWCFKEFSTSGYVEKDGVKYGTVMDTLTKKMAYKRAKDYDDLLTIIRTFTCLAGTKLPTQGTSHN